MNADITDVNLDQINTSKAMFGTQAWEKGFGSDVPSFGEGKCGQIFR